VRHHFEVVPAAFKDGAERGQGVFEKRCVEFHASSSSARSERVKCAIDSIAPKRPTTEPAPPNLPRALVAP
jgi:hypothetical protein